MTKSTSSGSQLVSTMPMTGIFSLRASSTAIFSFLRVDDEDGVGQARHAADAVEVLRQLLALFLVARDFLLRERVEPAVGRHRLEIAQPAEAALNRREVGEEAAQPALVDVEHPAALRFFGDDVLGLPLGADEQDRAAFGREAA